MQCVVGVGASWRSARTALRLIESATDDDGVIHAFAGETALFITPGYRFRAADVMMTNFHLPRSTLFMLVAAFCGLDVMQRAYAHAIAERYGSIPTVTLAAVSQLIRLPGFHFDGYVRQRAQSASRFL